MLHSESNTTNSGECIKYELSKEEEQEIDKIFDNKELMDFMVNSYIYPPSLVQNEKE